MNISSQMVRSRIEAGKDWKALVPSGAAAIIEDRRLYGFCGGKLSEDCSRAVILRIEAAVRESLDTGRFLHSRNTALLAHDLCLRFDLDPWAGYLAGVAHDLGKQLDNKQLLKLAESDGLEISALEKKKPNLLHGRAAAVLLKERFCIHNKEVLQAVAFHTSGSANMGPLAKVIYIADKLEVSRSIDPAWRKMCYEEEDLDRILYTVLNKTVSFLRFRELDLCDGTLRLMEKMKEKNR
jgi:nicotinate-nucleotide adenylyltransferase